MSGCKFASKRTRTPLPSTGKSRPTVLVDVAERVSTGSLNRPHRHNAVDDEPNDRLAEAMAASQTDPATRVVLLRGKDRSFCSGRDTAHLGERPGGESCLSRGATSGVLRGPRRAPHGRDSP
jgi:enoyl-CoA hydratase/carnithine racemase